MMIFIFLLFSGQLMMIRSSDADLPSSKPFYTVADNLKLMDCDITAGF